MKHKRVKKLNSEEIGTSRRKAAEKVFPTGTNNDQYIAFHGIEYIIQTLSFFAADDQNSLSCLSSYTYH